MSLVGLVFRAKIIVTTAGTGLIKIIAGAKSLHSPPAPPRRSPYRNDCYNYYAPIISEEEQHRLLIYGVYKTAIVNYR